MDGLGNPDDYARELAVILKRERRHTGVDGIGMLDAWQRFGALRTSEFLQALDWGVQRGWFRLNRTNRLICLTAGGLAAAVEMI